jgi:hypothetical protein
MEGSVQIAQRPIEAFIDLIRARDAFAFSRWGNGEWNSLFGRTHGQNRSGHRYYAEMGVELRQVLLNHPPYMLGMQNLALRLYEGRIEEWLTENKLDNLDWVNADVFHKASIRGQLAPLVQALHNAPSLTIVGPAHLRKLGKFLGFQNYVEIPLPDCYLTVSETLQNVMQIASTIPIGSVIGFSAAQPANLMIDALARSLVGQRLILIDFGSVWDPYAGVKSRSYMKDMDVAVVS